MLQFCRRTWGEYGDYINLVWDKWVRDRRGFFAVALLRGSPIGTAKLTLLGPGEVWFEGLRVDPAFRGAGVSHALTNFLLEKAERMGARTVRYSTGGRNLASQHIGKSWDFKLLRKYVCLEATADGRLVKTLLRASGPTRVLTVITGGSVRRGAGSATPARLPRKKALELLTDLLRSSRFVTAMRGLASRGWTFYSVDEGFLARAFRRNGVFLACPVHSRMKDGRPASRRKGARVSKRGGHAYGRSVPPVGLLIVSRQPRRRRLLVATLADLREDRLSVLLRGARRLAHDFGLKEVRVVLPSSRKMLNAARKAGYYPEYEGFSCVVMEKFLA